jgi:hypothetical protein
MIGERVDIEHFDGFVKMPESTLQKYVDEIARLKAIVDENEIGVRRENEMLRAQIARLKSQNLEKRNALAEASSVLVKVRGIVNVMEVARQLTYQHPDDEDEWDDDDQAEFERELDTILKSIPKLKDVLGDGKEGTPKGGNPR